MHIHILGICGTFMGGIAAIARDMGHRVTGSDEQIYPPMSTQLEKLGIDLYPGFSVAQLTPMPDQIIIGNAMKRGNPCIEAMLNQQIPLISAPQWLYENVLAKKHVLAVSGTHGKTTTSAMLTWILREAGLKPGYLIGGIPNGFPLSAALGDSPYFVIEADEYDSAFFDKRSKFIHYRPRTLLFNNLEYDHADIFTDLGAIQRSFHHLIRTIPSQGQILHAAEDENVAATLREGCWTPCLSFGIGAGDWRAKLVSADGHHFEILHEGILQGEVQWDLIGEHNVKNGLGAIVAAQSVGVPPDVAAKALSRFAGVKRRMEVVGEAGGITIYDDFAHHPTAIETTLHGLRKKVGSQRIIAILELRSYTMREGVHGHAWLDALGLADEIHIAEPASDKWSAKEMLTSVSKPSFTYDNAEGILASLPQRLHQGDHVIIMSNGGFGGIHQKLLQQLETAHV